MPSILDRSASSKAVEWWVDHAKKNPLWVEEDLAELSDDQKNELRALVQEADHA